MNKLQALNLLSQYGITRSSSAEDIQQVWRRLAMSLHPDRPGGDAEAFKRAKDACELLSSTKKPNRDAPSTQTSGFVSVSLFEAFNGTSVVLDAVTGEAIDIPAGARNGQQFETSSGKVSVLNIRESLLGSDWRVDWDEGSESYADAYKTVSVPVFKMILGGWHDVLGLDGKTYKIRIPAGHRSGSHVKISSAGYWKNERCEYRGNCTVSIVPEIKSLNEMDRQELESFMLAVELKLGESAA